MTTKQFKLLNVLSLLLLLGVLYLCFFYDASAEISATDAKAKETALAQEKAWKEVPGTSSLTKAN